MKKIIVILLILGSLATKYVPLPSVQATAASSSGKTRTYYIAVDEVEWDYAPAAKNQITGKPFDEAANVFVQNSADRIGSKYLKALYREYTDATFAKLKPRPADEAYLGFLGPILHAEVGDSIKVIFKNNASYPYSMHPHGVAYEKSSEGAPYNDGSTGSGARIEPGQIYTYTWMVPERAGPGPNDPSSVVWAYHSHVTETADVYSGLVGAIIVTRKGMAKPDGSPKDVDREILTMFEVADENASLYLPHNVEAYTERVLGPGAEGMSEGMEHTETQDTTQDKPKTDNSVAETLNTSATLLDPGDEEFVESNLMHSINGYVYGNMPMINLKKGEHVRWYLIGMGNEVDIHTVHWHALTALRNGLRQDVVPLMPATFEQVDMIPDEPGIWLFHCHVADHMMAGMMARFQVTP